MRTGIRYTRKPISTVLWFLVILLAALLVGVAASLYFSAKAVPGMLDQRMTTIAVHQPTHEQQADGSYQISNANSMIFEEDLEYLKSLPQVKDIDMRGLSGAYIEELTARIGLDDWFGMTQDIGFNIGKELNESYQNVVLIGTVESAFTYDGCQSGARYDLSAFGGGKSAVPISHCAIMRVEEVVSMHPDYPLFAREEGDKFYDGRIAVMFSTFSERPKSFFRVGKRYVVSGAYDPSLSATGEYPSDQPLLAHVALKREFVSFYAFDEGNSLACYRNNTFEEGDWFNATPDNPFVIKLLSREDRVPIAAEWNGTAEELREDAVWGPIVNDCERSLHSFVVLGTNYLESMYSFLTNEAAIVQGRTFTQEEYETGAKVAVMDEKLAQSAGLSVGDTVSVRQFPAAIGGKEGNSSIGTEWSAGDSLINSPTLGGNVFYHGYPNGEPELFTIVGLYRLENEWKNSICSFTPNTIFIPKKAQIEGAFGGPTVEIGTRPVTGYYEDGSSFDYEEKVYSVGGTRGVYMSIILENGQTESFLNRLKEDTTYLSETMTEEALRRYLGSGGWDYPVSGLGGHRFLCFDQGYEAAKESIDAVAASAGKLVLLIAGGAVLLFAMYLLLYQSSERKTVGIMRSLGAEPKRARRYLFASGFALAAVGILIGTFLSLFAARLVSDRLSALSVSQAGNDFNAAYSDLFRDMMREGSVPAFSLVLLATAEIGFTALVLFLQAYMIAKKNPRKLLGK